MGLQKSVSVVIVSLILTIILLLAILAAMPVPQSPQLNSYPINLGSIVTPVIFGAVNTVQIKCLNATTPFIAETIDVSQMDFYQQKYFTSKVYTTNSTMQIRLIYNDDGEETTVFIPTEAMVMSTYLDSSNTTSIQAIYLPTSTEWLYETQYTFSLQINTNQINYMTVGTTNPPPNVYSHTQDTDVTITAVPYAGYHLEYWIVDYNTQIVANETNTFTITMNASHTVTAVFAPDSTG